MGDRMIVTPPTPCGYTDVELAHEQMRRHRACRLDRCVWKAAAYHTLVSAGRLAPQSTSPRERAAARGIAFPAAAGAAALGSDGPAPGTLREVLDKLSELALPAHGIGVVPVGDDTRWLG